MKTPKNPATLVPGAAASRDLRLDFFRGVALICIFIDHIPENYLNYFTLSAIGFSDAAEVFIFISGFTASLVYGRAMAVRGALFATVQVMRRAWQLYVAHIFLFVIFIAEVSYTVRAFNNPMYNEEMGVGDFLEHPHIAVIQALILQFQPTYLDILPLYIVLLLLFPLVLVAIRRSRWLALAPALICYVAVQVLALDVPAYPSGSVWTFNPLAWQLLFVLGAVLGQTDAHQRGPAAFLRLAYVPAAVIAVIALVIRLSWLFHGFHENFPALFLRALWPVNKSNLAPIRLISFFAMFVLVAHWVSPQAKFLRSFWARPVVRCGSHSLEIFCLSILLSALGHFLMSEIASGISMQIAVNVIGIGAMCLTAAMLDWYRDMQRAPLTPAMPVGSQRGDGED